MNPLHYSNSMMSHGYDTIAHDGSRYKNKNDAALLSTVDDMTTTMTTLMTV